MHTASSLREFVAIPGRIRYTVKRGQKSLKTRRTMFTFCQSLIEGIIDKRKSQFTMLVTAEGQTGVPCHCPTTGRIGNIDGRSDTLLLCAALFKRSEDVAENLPQLRQVFRSAHPPSGSVTRRRTIPGKENRSRHRFDTLQQKI